MFLQRCFSNSPLRFGALFGAVLSSRAAPFVFQCVASRLHLRLRTWGIAVKEDEDPSFWTLVLGIWTGVALLVGLFEWRRMRRRLSRRCNLGGFSHCPADGDRFPEDDALPPVSLYPVPAQGANTPVTTENFVRISTGSIWDDDRDSVGASRSFRQITRGSKVSVFLTRQVDEYAREM